MLEVERRINKFISYEYIQYIANWHTYRKDTHIYISNTLDDTNWRNSSVDMQLGSQVEYAKNKQRVYIK